jgi:hypothetical protein
VLLRRWGQPEGKRDPLQQGAIAERLLEKRDDARRQVVLQPQPAQAPAHQHRRQLDPARGRYYPHQWPEGAAQGIIEFFDLLVG